MFTKLDFIDTNSTYVDAIDISKKHVSIYRKHRQYDNEIHTPSPAAIEAMRRFLVNVAMQPAPLPHIYPLRSGGIALEWTIGAWEASAEVEETGSQMTLNAVNIETLNEIDLMIDVHCTEIMPQFMTFINAMSKDEKIPNAKK